MLHYLPSPRPPSCHTHTFLSPFNSNPQQLYIYQIISQELEPGPRCHEEYLAAVLQGGKQDVKLCCLDTKPLEVNSVGFMVDNAQLGFLVPDCDHNLIVYTYLLEARESFGGTHLLPWPRFHVGAPPSSGRRQAAMGPDEKSVLWKSKHIMWFATLDGGIGLLLPIQEKTYQGLLMLQNALTTILPHHVST